MPLLDGTRWLPGEVCTPQSRNYFFASQSRLRNLTFAIRNTWYELLRHDEGRIEWRSHNTHSEVSALLHRIFNPCRLHIFWSLSVSNASAASFHATDRDHLLWLYQEVVSVLLFSRFLGTEFDRLVNLAKFTKPVLQRYSHYGLTLTADL